MADMAESVRTFRTALADAIGRSRRARGDATQRAEDFQRETRELANSKESGAAEESGPREAALAYRTQMGLTVEDVSADEPNLRPHTPQEESAAVESQEQTPSDGSDLDFSQARIMR